MVIGDEQLKELEIEIGKYIPMSSDDSVVVNIDGFRKVLLITQTKRGRKYKWIRKIPYNPQF